MQNLEDLEAFEKVKKNKNIDNCAKKPITQKEEFKELPIQDDELLKLKVIGEFRRKYGDNLANYVDSKMSKEELCLYERAYLLDPENPKRLHSLQLNTHQLKQMISCFEIGVDLAEEVQSGVTDEELSNLLKAIELNIPLNDLFTEDRRFIDYDKIKNLLEKDT